MLVCLEQSWVFKSSVHAEIQFWELKSWSMTLLHRC
jgi:hypothetical protein